MAYYPFAPENDAHYRLVSGTNVATFNDPLDPDFVGMLEEVTGLDGAEIRESAEDLVQADGGVHGDFYYGRRPIVISGRSYGHTTVAQRNARLDKLKRAANAMRSDATLAWKPSTRVENMIWNPRATVDLTYWLPATNLTRITTGAPGGFATGVQYSGTVSATFLSFGPGAGTTDNSGYRTVAVVPGRQYSVRGSARLVSVTSGAVQNIRLLVRWRKADGTGSSVLTSTSVVQVNNPVAGTTEYNWSGTATAPSDAAFAAVQFYADVTNPTTLDVRATGFSIMPSTSVQPYIDGDMTGSHWQGAPYASASGDFIEMYTTVRAQQPPRFTGGWVKNFQAALVSEYAQLFSAQQRSSGTLAGTTDGSVSHVLENRGSGKAMPIIRINGNGGANPYVENTTTGEIVRTNITLANGQWLDIDTLNHTATRETGAAANGSINYLTSSSIWPSLIMGNNTLRVVNAASMVVTYRDTWV